jgi:hypothetical protein
MGESMAKNKETVTDTLTHHMEKLAAEYAVGSAYHDGGKPDMINPGHYKDGGIETIDYIRAKLSDVEFKGYLKGNAIKYLSRAELKGGEEDYKKALLLEKTHANEQQDKSTDPDQRDPNT